MKEEEAKSSRKSFCVVEESTHNAWGWGEAVALPGVPFDCVLCCTAIYVAIANQPNSMHVWEEA